MNKLDDCDYFLSAEMFEGDLGNTLGYWAMVLLSFWVWTLEELIVVVRSFLKKTPELVIESPKFFDWKFDPFLVKVGLFFKAEIWEDDILLLGEAWTETLPDFFCLVGPSIISLMILSWDLMETFPWV